MEIEENQKTVSLASHRPWKSLRDSHISTASATSPLFPKSNRYHRLVERSPYLVPVIPASPLGSSFNWNVLQQSELVKRLGCHRQQVARMVDPAHNTKFEALEAALSSQDAA